MCSLCKEEFPPTEKHFHKQRASKDGFQAACKPCNIQRAAKWNKENLERRREIVMVSQKNHPETHRKSCTKFAKGNPELMKVFRMRRKARKLGAEGDFTKEDIKTLYLEQEGKCYYCASFMETVSLDHKIPLSRGGTNYKENLVLACCVCNSKKHTKTDLEFLEGVN